MSVYIHGMEMPNGCFYCIFNKHLDPDTDICRLTRDAFDSTFRVVEHRRDNCPIVPVQEHGALIDRDDFFAECYDNPVYGRLKVWNNPDDNGGDE